MAYYKDPHVERLYDIANKSNVKREKKKQELLEDFKQVLTNEVKDINIPSRRTFTFSDNSHLLNVALRRQNNWVSDYILNTHKEELNFKNDVNYMHFLILFAQLGDTQTFIKFFDEDRIKNIFLDNKHYSFSSKEITLVDGTTVYLRDKKCFYQHLTISAIKNEKNEIFNYLNDFNILDFAEVKGSFKAESEMWFIKEQYEIIKNNNLSVNVKNIDKECIKELKSLMENGFYTSKEIGQIIYNSEKSYNEENRFKLIQLVNEVMPGNKEAIENLLYNFVLCGKLTTEENKYNEKDIQFIKYLSDKVISDDKLVNIFFFRQTYKYYYDEKSKEVELVSSQYVNWDNYKILIKDRNMKEALSPLTNELAKKKSSNWISYPSYIKKILLIHPCLNLEKDFNIEIRDVVFEIKIDKNLMGKDIKSNLLEVVNSDMYYKEHINFLRNIKENPQTYKGIPFDEKNVTNSLRSVRNLSPWILSTGNNQLQDMILKNILSEDYLLKEVLYIKHAPISENFADEQVLYVKNYIQGIQNDLLHKAKNLSLSFEEINKVDQELKNIVGEIKTNKEFIEHYDNIFEKYVLAKTLKLDSNVTKNKKRL